AGRWEGGKVVWPEGTADQVPYNDLDWELVASEGRSCTFRLQDDHVSVVKKVAATGRPFELGMQLDVTNKNDEPRVHRLAVEQTDWRTVEETSGSWGKQPEFLTKVETRAGGETVRLDPGDFEPDEFEDEEAGFTEEGWRRIPGDA